MRRSPPCSGAPACRPSQTRSPPPARFRPYLSLIVPEHAPEPLAPSPTALVDALSAWFAGLADRGGAAVFLDDLQWADSATVELLARLAADLEYVPVVVIAAYRRDEVTRGHPVRKLRVVLRRAGRLAEIEVEPLGRRRDGGARARILGAPGRALARGDRSTTARRAVPFFVEELVAALTAEEMLAAGPDGLELRPARRSPCPTACATPSCSGRSGSSDSARLALEAAAVAGHRFELDRRRGARRAADSRGGRRRSGFVTEVRAGHRGVSPRARPRGRLRRRAVATPPGHPRPRGRGARPPRRSAPARGGALAGGRRARSRAARARRRGRRVVRDPCVPRRERRAAAGRRALAERRRRGASRSDRAAGALRGAVGRAPRSRSPLGVDRARDRPLRSAPRRQGEAGAGCRIPAARQPRSSRSRPCRGGRCLRGRGRARRGRRGAIAHGVGSRGRVERRRTRAARDAVEREALQAERADLVAQARGSRGQLLARRGQFDEGAAIAAEALELARSSGLAERDLRRVLVRRGDRDDPRRLSRRGRRARGGGGALPGDGLREDEEFCIACLAKILSKQGEWDRSLELARDVLCRGEPVTEPQVGRAVGGRVRIGRARPDRRGPAPARGADDARPPVRLHRRARRGHPRSRARRRARRRDRGRGRPQPRVARGSSDADDGRPPLRADAALDGDILCGSARRRAGERVRRRALRHRRAVRQRRHPCGSGARPGRGCAARRRRRGGRREFGRAIQLLDEVDARSSSR